MALNLASPGIQVREVDLTIGRVDAVSGSIGALVAPFTKGPVEEPQLIESEEDLLQTFGQPYSIDKHYEYWMVASSYLAYGGTMQVIRANDTGLKNSFVGILTAGDAPYVVYVSEHRGSYGNTDELKDYLGDNLDIVLFPISITRFEALKAKKELEKEGIKVGIANILWIKPFTINKEWVSSVKNSKYGGIILDDDYTKGVASNLAFELMKETQSNFEVMGLKDKSAGFSSFSDNLPPNYKEIISKVKDIIKSKKNEK